MAADFRDLLAPVGSGEGLQLPLDPLVLDPAWSFLPSDPVVRLPGESPHVGGGSGGEVPPLPAQAPAGLGMLESSLQAAAAAARGGAPTQNWALGPAPAAAPPLFVGAAPLLPLGASPFGAAGPAALPLHMPAAALPAGGGAALPGLAAGAAAAPLGGGGGGIAATGQFEFAAAALPMVGPSAGGMHSHAPSPAAEPVAVTVAQPAVVVVGSAALPEQQQQQQAEPERAARRSGGGSRGAVAPRSRSRGAAAPRSRSRGGRGSGRGRAAAASDSDYEAESAPSSDGEAGDESEEERAAAEARRKERLRAKNRRAQARYRLKQKAMYEQQEAAVEAAAADLERQRLANEALRERGAALEKIASFKDLSLQALQAAGGQAAAATGASHFNALAPPPTLKELRSGDSGSGAATGAAAPAVSSAASSGVQQQQAGAGGLPTADAQPVAASSASTGAGSSEGGVRTSSGGGLRRRPFEQRAEELTALANREQGGGLAAPSTTPMQQLRDEVLSMAADDFLQDWADFGALAAQTLAELDAGRISEQQAAARLAPAVQYRSLLHTAMLHYKPEVYKQLLAHTHFPEEGAEAAAQRWRTVALAMGCTRAQALQLCEQYQAYCSRLRQLSADSAACMRQLTSLAQEQLGPGPGPGPVGGMDGEGEEGSFLAGRSLRSMMASYLQLFEAAQRLARQPDAALVALLEFHTATGSVISGMQKARCAALYKPLFPDIVAIVRACLEQHGLLPPDAGTGRAVASAAAAPYTAA